MNKKYKIIIILYFVKKKMNIIKNKLKFRCLIIYLEYDKPPIPLIILKTL